MADIVIEVDSVDITDRVLFSDARFESLVNGQPGRGSFRVRDDDGSLTFTGGEAVLLKIDGANVWRGFLTQWQRIYIFPAANVSEPGLARFFRAECTDINVLFKKRIVFNQSDPDNVYGTLFGPGTSDLTAIQNLIANFLDLSGDGLNTTALVEEVADINVDQDARAWSGSYEWGQAMASIAMLPAAIYYIDPDRNLVYTDVDTPNAPFGLSDQPNGTTTRGYREMEILKDGTVLANDVLAWGLGYGSQTPVFVRDQSAASISTHGVWQRGEIKYGIYKQATINRVAESIIDGSPSSKRGAKDDRLTVALTTYEPGLRVADKVTFSSNVFGFTDVIPIRKMVITFEAPDNPRYDIVLSHEIDPPWSFIDPFFLNLPGMPKPQPPEPPKPPPPKRICPDDSPSACGITDTFTRTEAGTSESSPGTYPLDLGTSDSGFEYNNPIYTFVHIGSPGDPVASSVTGSAWRSELYIPTNGGVGWVAARLTPYVPLTEVSRSFTFTVTSPGTADNCLRIIFDGLGFGFGSGLAGYGVDGGAYITINPIGTSGIGPENDSEIGFTSGDWSPSSWTSGTPTPIPGSFWDSGSGPYVFTISHDDTTMTATISNFATSYSATNSHGDLTNWVVNPGIAIQRSNSFNNLSGIPWVVEIDNLNIPEVNSCSSRLLDDFQRVGSDWNTSSSGLAWVESFVQFADFTTANEGRLTMPYANAFNVPSGGTNELFDVPFTGAFTMRTLMEASKVDSVGWANFYVDNDDYTSFGQVTLNMSAGTVKLDDGTNTQTVAYGDWSDGDAFWVVWEWTPGVSSKVKLWGQFDPEPSTWLIQIPAVDFVTNIFGFFAANSRGFTPDGGQDTAIAIQQIGIDYDWNSCEAQIFDTFQRDVDPGWGTASSGYPWERTIHQLCEGCTDDDGYAEVSTFNPDGIGRIGAYYVSGATQTVEGWGVENVSDAFFNENEWILTTRVSCTGRGRLNFTVRQSDGAGSRFFTIAYDPADAHIGEVLNTDNIWTPIPGGFSQSTWYLIKWNVVNAFHDRLKIWEDGDPEPESWIYDAIPGIPMSSGPRDIRVVNSNTKTFTNSNSSTLVDYINGVCPEVECVDTFVGFPFNENITVTAGRTAYSTSTNYVEGSLRVFLNALLQRPGTDYIETNPSTGEFELQFTPESTDTIRVIYLVGA